MPWHGCSVESYASELNYTFVPESKSVFIRLVTEAAASVSCSTVGIVGVMNVKPCSECTWFEFQTNTACGHFGEQLLKLLLLLEE